MLGRRRRLSWSDVCGEFSIFKIIGKIKSNSTNRCELEELKS